jgi:hypothetical protein
MVHPTHSLFVYVSNPFGYVPFLNLNLSSAQEQSQAVGPISIDWPNSPSPSFILLTGGSHLTSHSFRNPTRAKLESEHSLGSRRVPCPCRSASSALRPLSHPILQGKPNASHMCARIIYTHMIDNTRVIPLL